MKLFQPRVLAMSIAIATIGGVSAPTFAQEETVLEEIVTVGTRGKPRSVTDSVAPVDVISGKDFQSQGGVDTANLLRNVVPSFNVNDQPISDAATLVRPANLRGLAPDHTLVLVNGQRRHRASVISWLYSIGRLLQIIKDPAFQLVLTEHSFSKRVNRINEPFYLICGYGDTGKLLAHGLGELNIRCVVVDKSQQRVDDLVIEENDIDANALFYTESEKAGEAAFYFMKNPQNQ